MEGIMRTISHFVKSLLVLFGILVVFVASDILPTLADQFVGMDAALLPLKQPVLFLSEGLLFLLLLGLGVIFYMLLLFDRRAYFTRSFSGSLTILIILCILADGLSLFLLGVLYFYGGPGPAASMFLVAAIFVITILALVFLLLRQIILRGKSIQDENELTI